MSLEERRKNLQDSLQQAKLQEEQLEAQLEQTQNAMQQMIGAIKLIDQMIAEEQSEATEG